MNTQREVIVEKLRKFCLYRDRSHWEVRNKLLEHKVYGNELETVMAQLISEDFLNEERFAKNYSTGKFKINGWGKIKINAQLKMKGVSEYNIRKGLESIDDHEYTMQLEKILDKKWKESGGAKDYYSIQKLILFGRQRGYEYDLIREILNEWKAPE